MSEQVDQHYQSQHHFLSESPWSAQAAMQKAAGKCNQRLGDWQQQSLGIDESSNRKAGKYSVGVGPQYNGNLGKVENSQTGVYASLSRGNRVGLINCRLFLPEDWVNNATRCKKAGVPKAAMVKKTKIDLALDMIRENMDAGIQFGWVNADGLYGNSHHFCSSIEDMGKDFVVDIHKDQRVYLSDPQPYLPEAISQKGRKPSRLKTHEPPVMVEDYLQTLKRSHFNQVKLRKGTKGWVMSRVHIAKVWVWDGREATARERTLIIRKGIKSKKDGHVKFALSNIKKEEKTAQQFVFMQGQRFWIERAFEDGKGELGMADYQVRKYNAWYHHQALVMIAMDYINETKNQHKESIPLLSVRDVRLQLIDLLKNQGVEIEKEIDQMITRHKQRKYDIDRYYPDIEFFQD